jgi:hypothetical protein
MKSVDCLSSLELLRDFVAKFVPLEVYMKNLFIDRIETPNRRLWALRESMRMNEVDFAETFGIAYEEYHQFEQSGSAVPEEFLKVVAARFSIPIAWVQCECPILPIPKPVDSAQE